MNEYIEEIIAQLSERLDSSIEYEWTGGFDKKFLLDWLRSTLQAFANKRDEELREKVMLLALNGDANATKDKFGGLESMQSAWQIAYKACAGDILALLSQPTITSNTESMK